MRAQLNLLSALLLFFTAQSAMARYEAHEWGTFTSLVGSNGITQNGMYHEDEKLPDFVHPFGITQEDLLPAPRPGPAPTPNPPRRPCRGKLCFDDEFFNQNLITQKMETPVIYFYSDTQRRVDVNVRFPDGLITDTYPAPVRSSPSERDARRAENGTATFQVDVLPQLSGRVPYVDSHNIYSHARNVASNIVRTNGEQEKFIFYRGVGRFQPKISITSRGGSLELVSPNARASTPAAFLVHVTEQGEGRMLALGAIERGQPKVVKPEVLGALRTHDGNTRHGIIDVTAGRQQLVAGLVSSGLNYDEAVAMIDTWNNGYLRTPGLRLLYILPRHEADEVLPLSISPAPEKLERVFVARIEVLLDTEENAILERLRQERASFQLSSLGRFAEPMLRRILEVFDGGGSVADPELRQILLNLIDQAAKSGT